MEPGTFSPVHLTWLDVGVRLGGAVIFALAIGLERFLHKKPSDFRPFVIISMASCVLMMALMDLAYRSSDTSLSIDPAKVVSGVMSGIGFLGAGALFRDAHVIQGAGSASAIWASGAIGLTCGLGAVWLAALLGIFIVVLFLLARGQVDAYDAKRTPSPDSDGDRDGCD